LWRSAVLQKFADAWQELGAEDLGSILMMEAINLFEKSVN
jgi:hypothetical protein